MRSAALIFALLVVLSGVAPVVASTPGVDASDSAAAVPEPPTYLQQEAPSEPRTEIRIAPQPNTDARWTITFRYALADQNETAGFRAFSREFEAGNADTGLDAELFRGIAQEASTATGREMAIRDVRRTARIENETGVLTLSFTWTNFLESTDEGGLRVGDAMRTASGETWLDSLSADQRLVFVIPDGYVLSSTGFRFVQQNDSVIVTGPREFGPEREQQLTLTYRQADQLELPWDLIVGGGGALVVLSVLVSVLVLRRRSDSDQERVTANGGESSAASAGGDGADSRSGTDGDSAVSDSAADASDAPGDERVGAAEGDGPETEDTEEAPDFELLSDEERVEYLLEQNGGRMKQANIVAETGWSDAKVSQLLSAMADAGRVNKLRLGRENLISLPDEDEADDGDDG